MIPSVPFRFDHRRVLVTPADVYMGPAIAARFRAAGATVVEDGGRYVEDDAEPQRVIAEAGRVDVLILNLLAPPVVRPAADITDDDWLSMFDHMVHPTMRFVRASRRTTSTALTRRTPSTTRGSARNSLATSPPVASPRNGKQRI